MEFQIVLWIVISTGFLAAVVALYGRYKTLPAIFTGPEVCQLEDGGCQILFRSQKAAMLGLPNAFYGSLFYPILGLGLYLQWPVWLLWAGSCLSLCMSVFLARSLIRKKLECRICWTGHFSNLTIWLILLYNLLV